MKSREPSRWFVTTLFAAIGGFSLVAQTLLFREYLISFQGNELGIAIFYATWLGWIAVGALLAAAIGRGADRAQLSDGEDRAPIRLPQAFLSLVPFYPLAVVLQLLLTASVRSLAGIAPFELFPLGAFR